MKNYNFQLVYKKYNKKSNIIKNIFSLLLLTIFAVIVLMYGMGNLKILHILSNSSAPYHSAGSLAVDYKVPFETLKVGDFITWSISGGQSFVTHQIVKVDKENKTVITCQQRQNEDGTMKTPEELLNDSSISKDAPITEDKYYGKVIFSIPNLGLYMTNFKNMVINNGRINITGIITLILSVLLLYLVSKLLYKKTYTLTGR